MPTILFSSEHTPFLLAGLWTNVYISLASMIVGTLLGTMVAILLQEIDKFKMFLNYQLTSNAEFVLMFYIAFVLPNEITILDLTIQLTPEYKAALALVFPVLGFSADQFLGLVLGDHDSSANKVEIYMSSWIQYFLIILMASVTASVIGADEILSRPTDLFQQGQI